MKKIVIYFFFVFLLLTSSCSINQFATRVVANALTSNGGGSVFNSDDDPEFIEAALPFALKTYESLLEADPKNTGLFEAVAGGYVSYANAFLQSPAELMEYDQIDEKDKLLFRAAAMYRRGGRFATRGLEILYPGFNKNFTNGDWEAAFVPLKKDAVPFLYWEAASILGEFSVDSFNPELMVEVPSAVALAVRALELDENYKNGTLNDLLISVFANLPENMIYKSLDLSNNYSVKQALSGYYAEKGLDFDNMSISDQALFNFNLSVDLSHGKKVAPYVSIVSLYINNQDLVSFTKTLNDAISVDIDLCPENKLQNIISQRKARWLLDHKEDYFFIP
ncbi:MAG: hypothetical protein J7L71_06790 [Spirochaetaceae bacterium]|nr:hypothetical protein [Spirochaetaceae bacterium]